MRVITMATDASRLLYLQQSAGMFQMPITCIMKETWGGYEDKITTVLNALQDLPDEEVVCFIDAYDVLVNGTLEELEEKFKAFDSELVVSAELNCYPSGYRDRLNGTHPNRFPNAGGYIGTVRAIRRMFEWLPMEEIVRMCRCIFEPENMPGTDQAYVIEYVLHHGIPLDTECSIFQSMIRTPWETLEFVEGRMRTRGSSTRPCFLHFNGGAYQKYDRTNIMPVFVQRMHESRTGVLTLWDHPQLPFS